MLLWFLAFSILIFLAACQQKVDYAEKIIDFAKTSNQFTLGEVLDFEWDRAFHALPYAGSNYIKEEYHLIFDVDYIDAEDVHRLLFFSKGKFVMDLQYSVGSLYIETMVKEISPDMVFAVNEQKTTDKCIYLKIQET